VQYSLEETTKPDLEDVLVKFLLKERAHSFHRKPAANKLTRRAAMV